MSKSIYSVQILRNNFPKYSNRTRTAYNKAFRKIVNDVIRTSSQSAPHKTGYLEGAYSEETKVTGDNAVCTVSYSAVTKSSKGDFNYALDMHEKKYNLGAGSRAKAGGVGMSGKQYPVGTGFLGDVVKGEQEAYADFIEKSVKSIKL